ncbi:MAG: CopD family protein [Chloroflexi bacterium]|nr:CopD family protein [Chloroflexota bacterium]
MLVTTSALRTPGPRFRPIHDMYQAAVFIHLASAIVWIGGSLFLALVLIPVLRRFAPPPGEPPVLPPDMLGAMARRFRWISWVCIVLLVATGLYILPTRYGIGFGDFFSLGGHFVATLQVKVALVAVVIWLSAIHDFIIGPYTNRLIEAMQAGAEPPGYLPLLRKSVVWIARVNVLLTILVVVVAVTMTRGAPV